VRDVPFHVPGLAVKVLPTTVLPLIEGATTFDGACGFPPASAVVASAPTMARTRVTAMGDVCGLTGFPPFDPGQRPPISGVGYVWACAETDQAATVSDGTVCFG
jgi:hypothetical protein